MRETALQMYGSTNTIDHTEGIFQSIGYKEFSELDLNDDPASDPKFPNMLAQTKLRTYQYARSQLKWIRKQLLPAVREARSLGGEVEVFAVPGGVAEPAEQVLKGELERDFANRSLSRRESSSPLEKHGSQRRPCPAR